MTRSDSVLWKSPYIKKKPLQKVKWRHKNATKNFDYTTIADRLRMIRWSDDGNQTGLIKPVYGIPTFPLNATAQWSKGHTLQNLKSKIKKIINLNSLYSLRTVVIEFSRHWTEKRVICSILFTQWRYTPPLKMGVLRNFLNIFFNVA